LLAATGFKKTYLATNAKIKLMEVRVRKYWAPLNHHAKIDKQ